MSVLSEFFHRVAGIVSNALAKAPAEQQQPIADAHTALTQAAGAVEAALPVAIKIGVDAFLADYGWGAYIPNANGFLDLVIAELASRKTAPKAA